MGDGDGVKMAFKPQGVDLPLNKILPLKALPKHFRSSARYQRIKASMQEVGIIEPPVVHPHGARRGSYLLLDGHVRLAIAAEIGYATLFCQVATDDEALTYNHKINQVSPIQEHFMLLKAIKNGVSEERIARTLKVDIAAIRQKRDLLKGICPEAVALLKDRRVCAGALQEMKKAQPMRQIEMAELMIAANNLTTAYAKCILAGSSSDQLLKPGTGKLDGLDEVDLARMQREMQHLERDFKAVQNEYGQNMLNLVVVVGYLRRILGNAAVVRYLSRAEPAMLGEFQQIVESHDLRATG